VFVFFFGRRPTPSIAKRWQQAKLYNCRKRGNPPRINAVQLLIFKGGPLSGTHGYHPFAGREIRSFACRLHTR
jgi:hypothetical protein